MENPLTSSTISFLIRMFFALKNSSKGCCSSLHDENEISQRASFQSQRLPNNSYRLILLNWCSPNPPFRLTVISKVLLAEIAPPTRDMVTTEIFSICTYVAGLGTNMRLLSRKYKRPSFALIEHLTPLWPWWLTKSFDGMMTFLPDKPLKIFVMTWCIGSSYRGSSLSL